MAVAVIALSMGFINNRSGLRTTDLHLDSNVRAADKPGGMETGRVSEAVWCLWFARLSSPMSVNDKRYLRGCFVLRCLPYASLDASGNQK